MAKGGSPKKDSKRSSKKGSDKSPKKSIKKETVSQEDVGNDPITHVIFDLDGVLIDSVRFFELFLNKLIGPYDRIVPQWLQEKIRDRKLESIAKIVVKELSLPMTRDEFLNYYKEWTPAMLQNVNLLPGVCRLVSYFKKHKIPMAVVTDSTEENYNYKIQRHKIIFDKFSHAVCYGSDPEANKGKPAPYIYQIAGSRFKDDIPKSPRNILVFEDTSDGVDAALAAEMKVVWVPDPRIDTSLHNFNKNLMVINSLVNFEPELWRLPPFSGFYSI